MIMMSSRFTSSPAQPVIPSPLSRGSIVLGAVSAIVASLLLAGCSTPDSPPRQVESKNPSVTYTYRGDKELLQANQNAETYCSQYHSLARTANISSESDGSKTVVFDCVASNTVGMQTTQPLTANQSYSYSSDQQLLDASRNAQLYCENNGTQRAVATTVVNADGTKTVSFLGAPL
jgi:hypothetical protein